MIKIPLRNIGITILPTISHNELAEDKILEAIKKRTGMLKSKLNFINRSDCLVLRLDNIELLDFRVVGDSKSGYFITTEEK
jgi:hypothetical protein